MGRVLFVTVERLLAQSQPQFPLRLPLSDGLPFPLAKPPHFRTVSAPAVRLCLVHFRYRRGESR